MKNNDISEPSGTCAVRCMAAILMIACLLYHAFFLCLIAYVGISFFSIAGFLLPQAFYMIGEFVWILLSLILSIWGVSRTFHSPTFRSRNTVIILLAVLGLSVLNYSVIHPAIRDWSNGESIHKLGL